MSSLAYPRDAVLRRRLRRADPTATLSGWGTDVLLAVAVAGLAVVLLLEVAGDFNVDSWLALVTGREVWQSGIPHRETLTVMSQGASWVDQQWLSQLASYAIYLAGGLGLLATVNVALLAGPVAFAVVAARRLGAPSRSVLLLFPVCLAMITPSREVRTQEFAFPLFIALIYLLARDGREPSRRVFWCLPILVLWANLHGSVTMGAGLVMLRGLTVAWERRHLLMRSAHAWLRPLALMLGAPLAALITPYGLAIVGYYRTTMADSTLRHFVTEWKPVTAVPTTAAAVFVIAGIALWSLRRNPGKTTSWEKLALVALAAASVSVVRNAVFLGLFALMIVPVSLAFGPARADGGAPPDRRRAMINALLALSVAAALLFAIGATISRSDASIQWRAQQPGVVTAVARAAAADPSLKVLADGQFSDWLLWRDPALSGRVANDVRFELLSSAQLEGLESVFYVTGPDFKRAARGYRLLVLSRQADPRSVPAFLREPGRRVLYDQHGQVVILRNASETDRS